MESQVLQALGKTSNKKTSKFHLKLNFNNFQERKNRIFRLIATLFSQFKLTLLDSMSTKLMN